LTEEGDRDAPEAPVVEEGSEGVRIMTVHRAKGLEFPVVVLADIGANLAAANPGRHIDAERGVCAVRLAGWSPWNLLDHEGEEHARDRAEGLRVAYVAATRARDLLVVPAVGDDPFAKNWEPAGEGWIEPVQRAVYPDAAARRAPERAPACPSFGADSVLERPDQDAPGRDNVQPGLHVLGASDDSQYPVVWWDPHTLALDVEPVFGIRHQDLIEDPGPDLIDADRRSYQDWLAERLATLERGSQPSVVTRTVTEWAAQRGPDPTEPVVEVTVVDAAASLDRPSGPRFGTLVHAVLATVALDAAMPVIAETVALEARLLGATPEEEKAATNVVETALAHPLLLRAREAWRHGRCRRESPIAVVDADGTILEGVLDLAFEEEGGWTVVDFKTQAELTGPLARYRRQVSAYASVVSRVTGRPATAILLRL
jgi:ATP-dependent exoDNAse (exonuclease V) beta subunit